jgi:glycosyltransferase involved in cell wall biosynthesis
MKIVSTSYSSTPSVSQPAAWLDRISFYTGILESLAKDHQVISFERISYEGNCMRNGVEYRFIKLRRNPEYWPTVMHDSIKNINPDVVLVNGFIFPFQILQLKWKLGKKTRIIILHRAEKPAQGYSKVLQKLADRCVDAYFFASREQGMDWVHKNIIRRKEKIHEILQSSSNFKPLPESLESRGPVFLFVGRLDANKDPSTVLRAFLKFQSSVPSALLVMIFSAGDLLKELKSAIPSSKSHCVQFVKSVPHAEMEAWYRKSQFILSGSHYEGSGIAVIEAMSCGCIPLLTDIPSFRRITGGKCGWFYPPGNEEALLHLLQSTSQMNLKEERENTLLQFQSELSFDAIGRKINKLLHTYAYT